MAYTAPSTWTLGTTPTAALFNTDIRDNELSLRNLNSFACKLYRTTATLGIPNGARTNVTWQASAWNVGSMWNSGVNPTRVTVPITGRYIITMNGRWENLSNGVRGVGYRINGVPPEYDCQHQLASAIDTTNGIDMVALNAGDYVEMRAYNTRGGMTNLLGSIEGNTWFSVRLAATGIAEHKLWVPPKDWAAGQILSPALLNTYIRDAVAVTRNHNGVGAKVWLSKDFSASDDDRSAVTWDRSEWNFGSIWDGGSQFVAPCPGWYQLTYNLEWEGNDGGPGTRMIGYIINDKKPNVDLQAAEGNTTSVNQSGGDLVYLKQDDALEAYIYSDGGESMSARGGARDRSRFSIDLIAAV